MSGDARRGDEGQELEFGRGATLFSEGEPGDFCYLILSGRVEVFRMAGDAKQLLAELAEGTVVGEMALIAPAPRSASVVAVEHTVCRRVNAEALERALDRSPPLARYLLQTLIRNIRHAGGSADPLPRLEIPTGHAMAAAIRSELRANRVLDRKVFATGDTAFRTGQPGTDVYLVQSGRIALLRELPDGTKQQLRGVGPGEVFGELAVLSGQPRRATAIAMEASVCELVPAPTFLSLINSCPAVIRALLRIYATAMLKIAVPAPSVQPGTAPGSPRGAAT